MAAMQIGATDTMPQEPNQPQGVGIMVSYQELVTIRTQQATMMGMLQAALALQGTVAGIEKRLGRVENILSGKAGERRTWNTILGFIVGVVTMALGGGATMYLPILLGWHR